ncbi:MAG: DivIVA domain-containing protein [Clostridia bacterium]|nr:DivIVA domain-containing protein [Clostridia bacterium]MBR2288833.1 DivIVA domain-containing protein [Clostridia bacterium]
MQKQITIDVIESKEFSIHKNGYDQDEVDAFLDDICDEMEKQLNQISRLQADLRQAQLAAQRPAVGTPQPVTVSKESEASFREILEMAQKVKDETIQNAKKQAEEIIADAGKKAQEQLGSLSEERDSLQAQVDTLKKSVSDFKDRLKTLISEQQSVLDRIAEV